MRLNGKIEPQLTLTEVSRSVKASPATTLTLLTKLKVPSETHERNGNQSNYWYGSVLDGIDFIGEMKKFQKRRDRVIAPRAKKTVKQLKAEIADLKAQLKSGTIGGPGSRF